MRFNSIAPIAAIKLLLVITFLACADTISAQPIPQLSNTVPVYIRRGESREIALTGKNLSINPSIALPDAKGVKASLILSEKAGETPRLKCFAAPDAALGDRELRIITPTGVTQPLILTIGQYPLVLEKEPNNTPESAQAVSLPACILGTLHTAGDADFFRFDAKKGEHLIFDLHAMRDRSPLEPVLTVHDSTGRELPHQIELHAGDPMLVFDTPTDGSYLLQVRDLRYRGGGDFSYRIEAGAIPYIESLEPMSGPPAPNVVLVARGHNLGEAQRIMLDLRTHAPGPTGVRAHTPSGDSNEAIFFVTKALGTTPTADPLHKLPVEMGGVLEHPNDEHTHKFRVATRQQVTLTVTAHELGSPLDALLTLKSNNGNIIEQSNGSPDSDARISRMLEPGEYVVALRDLTFAGGTSYSYRLNIGVASPAPDFSVRFLPDTVRLPRGGNAKLWCEIKRTNGWKLPVNLTVYGLPAGVTGANAVIDESTSGILTLAASSEVAVGTYPIHIVAIGTGEATRRGSAELNNRVVQQAYLTVTEAAPMTVSEIGVFKPEQLDQYFRTTEEFTGKLNTPTPQLAAAQTEWEKGFKNPEADSHGWRPLNLEALKSSGGTHFVKQPDSSIRADGGADKDTYTFTATTEFQKIVAIRLEALSDDALPSRGPGTAPNGNFVLNKFTVTAAPKSDPGKFQAVAFNRALVTFEQGGFPAGSAVGVGVGGGWAISPETGKSQVAVFFANHPIAFDGGTLLNFSLDQQFGGQHLLGRFRLSVSTDPKATTDPNAPMLPESILALIKKPAEKRTTDEQSRLAVYYRSIAPELAVDRTKLETLRQTMGPHAELHRMAAQIRAAIPNLDRALQQIVGTRTLRIPTLFSEARNRTLVLPISIVRSAGFNGDIQVTLEGFSSGRDPVSHQPTPIARDLAVVPLTIKGSESLGQLIVKVNPTCEIGMRMVAIRAEAKVGNDTWVQYGPAFPLTVKEK